MPPESLQSSYTLYKEYTNALATWLVETASQLQGYQSPSFPAAIRNKGQDTDAGPIKYSPTIKELQKLAEIVGSSGVTIPESVLSMLKRNIELRKTVTSWFIDHGDSVRNHRHAYFITVLGKMYDELAWRTKPTELDVLEAMDARWHEAREWDESHEYMCVMEEDEMSEWI